MINVPTIPTDSLYKFYFVAGFILIFASMFILYHSATSIRTNTNKIDSVGKQFLNHLDRHKGNHLLVDGSKINSPDEYVFKDSLTQQKYIEWQSLTKKTETYVETFIALVFAFIGSLWMHNGGKNWQKRLQEPQDRILQIQLELLEKELKATNIRTWYKSGNPVTYSKNIRKYTGT